MDAYIYKLSWYATPRHMKSQFDMYFISPHHILWAFNFPDIRIHFIKVSDKSPEYLSALENDAEHTRLHEMSQKFRNKT